MDDDRERQLALEGERRTKVAVCAVFAGLLVFVGSAYGDYVVFAHYPTIGLLQALTPTLHGVAKGAADPRSAHVIFTSHHAAGLIVASCIVGIGSLLMIPPLRYLADAVRLRGKTQPTWKYFATFGGIATAVFAVVVQVVAVTRARDFVHNADYSKHAVDQALSASGGIALALPATLGQIMFAVGFGMISYLAMSVGLLKRLLGVLGAIAAVLFVIPVLQAFEPLPVLQIVWLISFGALLSGRTASVLPPAWTSGEAEPWPTQQRIREARGAGGSGRRERGTASAVVTVPAPRLPGKPSANSSKKRKKRR
ncbi:MAG TPA: hypothetical protein VG165_05205 [Solirubrobacteraceae bacterium]|jgi:hypothetical protein|nr:hypothetical protein [Solirubrobacteraceae bacterium]